MPERMDDMSVWRRKIFTLIELLIVVAIIAILMGVLLPALNSARKKAFQATCFSNMKSIGSGFLQYTLDFNDYLPALYSTNTVFWPVSIRNYIGKPGRILPTGGNQDALAAEVHIPAGTYKSDIFLCPDYRSDPGGYNMRRTYVTTTVTYNIDDGGFTWNHDDSVVPSDEVRLDRRPRKTVRFKGQSVILIEKVSRSAGYGYAYDWSMPNYTRNPGAISAAARLNYIPYGRHPGFTGSYLHFAGNVQAYPSYPFQYNKKFDDSWCPKQ